MTQPDETREPLSEAADADLVLRTRSGNSDAFGELWRRHYRSGLTVARNMTSSIDADDLVQEAYARIYQSIRKGGGPTGSFRAYLFTSIRNTASGWGRSRKETTLDEFEDVEDPTNNEQATNEALDRSLTHQAFRSLPTRWQEVLWYSEIERMGPAEIAPLLGMKATAVAQLAFRAREGLRQAWIQAHLNSVEDGSEHQWTIEHLGAYARNNLGVREHARIEDHLSGCARCTIVAGEAKEVGSRLALVLLPLALGAVGATGYLAALQSGVPTTVALAAMPSSVTQGAVTIGASGAGASGAGMSGAGASSAGSAAGSGSGAGAGAGVGAGAGAGAGAGVGATVAAGAASGAAAGGILSGVGGVLALAAAGVVLVGGIATAVVLPGIIAGNQEQVTAIEAPAPPNPEPQAPAPVPAPSNTPSALPVAPVEEIVVTLPLAEPVRPPAPPAPTTPPTAPPAPPVQPTTPPVEPSVPPVEPSNPPVDPVDPGLPAGVPAFSAVRAAWAPPNVALELTLQGVPNSAADVLFFSAARERATDTVPDRDVRASGVFDALGSLTVRFTVTPSEFIHGALRLQYTSGDQLGQLGEALTMNWNSTGEPTVPPTDPIPPVDPVPPIDPAPPVVPAPPADPALSVDLALSVDPLPVVSGDTSSTAPGLVTDPAAEDAPSISHQLVQAAEASAPTPAVTPDVPAEP